jgi:acyl-CoA synthetase (AMP-forming)/AMP-acid ligase II
VAVRLGLEDCRMNAQGPSSQGLLRRWLQTFSVLGGAGLLNPSYILALAKANKKWGPTIAAGFAASAGRRPGDVAVVDDRGSLTFGELHQRSNAIANGLAAAGIRAGQGVGIFCRNHRAFVEATVAVAKIGADALFLNTGFAGPQLGDVLDREEAVAVIHDEEFTPVVEAGAGSRQVFRARHEKAAGAPSLDELIARHSAAEPAKPGRSTLLTSGTTGTPKGARRETRSTDLETLVGVLAVMPYEVGQTIVIAAPTFHAWGLAQLTIAGMLSSKIVLRRRFDPEGTLAAVAAERARALALVPVMMQRILALPADAIRRHDTSCLRLVGASGSALPGELAIRWMNTFGDNLYNFYGSTEVAQASIAGPADLRAAPGTAGRVPRGAVVKILDENGREMPTGKVGRIFVANQVQFEGYTGGGGKEIVGGMMSSGDVGYFDDHGRLFVVGRDDDMIISGGENVFPKEVEDLLADHEAVDDVAVIGVPDEEFGQRLKAFVVRQPGSSVTENDLKEYVRQRLARYKIPRSIELLDEIPRNPTGKVLKRVLRERSG